MKVLVTGANGFLASNIIRELNARNIKVKGMVRRSGNLISLVGTNYEKVIGNMDCLKDIMESAKGCDVIIHAAANTSQRAVSQPDSADLQGTKNVILAAEKYSIHKLIYVSSANTIGFGTQKKPGIEKDQIDPLFLKSDYASNKLKSENLILKAVRTGRINALVVNPSFMVGPYDAKPSSGKLMLFYLNGRIAICPTGGKSFVYVGDVAKAICNAIERGRKGQCYLLTGENLKYQVFYQKIKNVTGVSKPVLHLTPAILKQVGHIGKWLNIVGFRSEMNPVNASILGSEKYYAASKAIEELNMPQTPIEVGIEEAFTWFAENKYIKRHGH